MPEVVAQHQVAHPEPGGAGQEVRGQRPSLQGRPVGLAGAVEVVVEPQGVEAELLGAPARSITWDVVKDTWGR